MSLFANLPEAAPDAAFALVEAYKADNFPLKVDLSPGFYRDEDARPWILPSVEKVALTIAIRQSLHLLTCLV
jgi:aspartate aminotransferase